MGVSEIEKLRVLVDSSLHSPDYGVVNFQQLHKVLHGILLHLGLQFDGNSVSSSTTNKHDSGQVASDLEVEPGEKRQEKDEETSKEACKNDGFAGEEKRSNFHDENDQSTSGQSLEDGEVERLKSHQKHLENKISDLEDKLKLLDEFPSNKTIIQEAQQADSTANNRDHSLSGIWQFMKINRRLQAAEDGIDRIMSIIHEFLGSGPGKSLGELSNSVQDLSAELQQLKDQLNNSTLQNDQPRKDDNLVNNEDLKKHLSGLATKEELKEYVKWPALEEALQVKKEKSQPNIMKIEHQKKEDIKEEGVKEQMKEEVPDRPKSSPAPPTKSPVPVREVPKTAMVTEATQVSSNDLPDNEKGTMDEEEDSPSGSDSPHPSPELVECLRRISELNDEHAKMNEIVANKMDKGEVSIPKDLQDQLNELRKGLDSLTQNSNQSKVGEELKNVALDNKDKIDSLRRELAALSRQAKQAYIERPPAEPAFDNEILEAIQKKLTEFETDQNRANGKSEQRLAELMDSLSDSKDHIESLYKHVQTLQDIKADKDNVALEMDDKADKAALENKVNTTTFDTTFTMLDEGLREALQKMDDYMNEELALKNALKQLSCDMKEKMDSDAFKAMQNYLEKRIADVQKSRTMIAKEANVDLSNAAGIRRPLPVDFHCISCNRPVDVKYDRNIEPSLPKSERIPFKRSKGPYLTYEIDQLRHFNRSQQPSYRPDKVTSDAVSISRPCGGIHTVVGQQLRKPTRIHNTVNGSSREEQVHYPNWTREVSIIDFLKGTDGHMYKGRYKTIPPISNRHKHTPSESDLPPLRKELSPPLTGHKWSSEPELSRARDEGDIDDGQHLHKNTPAKPITPPITTNISSNARYKRIVNQRPSDLETSKIPSPSPPSARENEHQRRIDREEFLRKQQQELAEERIFSPRKEYHPKVNHTMSLSDLEKGEVAHTMYSPQSPKLARVSKSEGRATNLIGLDLANGGRMSVDSIDDAVS